MRDQFRATTIKKPHTRAKIIENPITRPQSRVCSPLIGHAGAGREVAVSGWIERRTLRRNLDAWGVLIAFESVERLRSGRGWISLPPYPVCESEPGPYFP